MRKILGFCVISFIAFVVFSCGDSDRELPYIGEREVDAKGDSVYHSIPDFEFINQDGDTITHEFSKIKSISPTSFYFMSHYLSSNEDSNA